MATEKKDFSKDFNVLFIRAKSLGLTQQDISQLQCVNKLSGRSFGWKILLGLSLVAVAALAVVIARVGELTLANYATKLGYGDDEQCFLENYEPIADMMRPVVDCNICRDVIEVDRVTNLTHGQFMEKYAFTGRPVVVTDGTKGWTAADYFSFKFFKKIYKKNSPNLSGEGGEECQFFPYRTNFENLGDVFRMPPHMRDGVSGKPWYIGWSNCDTRVGNILRKLYNKPYFLPDDVESSRTDWIFMGSPKYGAHMHIDAVGKVSWQAQVVGTKVWTLVPPPECWYQCPHRHDVLLNEGDILVVDTNKWFHSTLILNNTMSITIGSEFE